MAPTAEPAPKWNGVRVKMRRILDCNCVLVADMISEYQIGFNGRDVRGFRYQRVLISG